MNNKIISIFLVLIFLISALPTTFAADRFYVIDSADIFVDVKDDGLLSINESYVYNFKGQYNGVYREIPLKEGESIENLYVYADGAYTKLEPTNEDGVVTLKVYLYADKELSEPISNKSVRIHYNYDMANVTKVYNDIGELQFKVVGENWDQRINDFNAHVRFPSNGEVQYWINPAGISLNQSWNNNVLNIHSNCVSPNDYIEIRAVIPLSDFSNPVNAKHINATAYDEIVEIQENYQDKVNFEKTVEFIIPIMLTLTLIYPVITYVKYGQEPKVKNKMEYLDEPPSDEDPMFVDAMFSTKSNVGSLSSNGIQAAIMEMINDGKIRLADKDIDEKTLKLVLPTNTTELKQYEQDIVDLLKQFEKDEIVDLSTIKDTLKDHNQSYDFYKNMHKIKDNYEEEIKPSIENYFIDGGSKRFKLYSIVLIIISISYLISLIYSKLNIPLIYYIISLALIVISIIMFSLPNRIGGRWTEEGINEFYKWKAFKRFLNDFTLIKECPPESISIWNKYLVYATALGNADAVKKAMDVLDIESYAYDNLYYYNQFGGPVFISHAFYAATSASGSGGGAGGIGGGSGGGGGGAF